jgi:hypothetical protein
VYLLNHGGELLTPHPTPKLEQDDQIKEDEPGRASSKHGEVRMCKKVWFKSLRGRDY